MVSHSRESISPVIFNIGVALVDRGRCLCFQGLKLPPIRLSKDIERNYNERMGFEDAQHLVQDAVEE
jgi:hypothetical protein